MPRKWIEGNIIEILDASPTTKRFFLKIDSTEIFNFKAGQFVTMDLPIGEKRQDRWRSYSIASAPDETNILEFCVVKTDPGFATKYLFEDIKIGGTINFRGPQGSFCLPKNLNQEFVFICTGTGVAPFRSMIHNLINQNHSFKSINLFFGTRYHAGILYKDEFEAIASNNENFNYSYILSRDKTNGKPGYVHELYLDEYKQPSQNILFFLCGWQNMVDEARKNLLNLGFEKNQIIEELYG